MPLSFPHLHFTGMPSPPQLSSPATSSCKKQIEICLNLAQTCSVVCYMTPQGPCLLPMPHTTSRRRVSHSFPNLLLCSTVPSLHLPSRPLQGPASVSAAATASYSKQITIAIGKTWLATATTPVGIAISQVSSRDVNANVNITGTR